MGYAAYLRGLLQPLDVYALDGATFSGGEVEALGQALDDAWECFQADQAETLISTAIGDGLRRYEQLFGIQPESPTVQARRAALAALLRVGGDSFSVSALSDCLAACGVRAIVAETDTPATVAVSFPDTMGEPDGYDHIREVCELLLPCHLAIEYRIRYVTWGEVSGMTWRQAGELTWREFMKGAVG
jgi:hypothetical protein